MPSYDYYCPDCGHRITVSHSMGSIEEQSQEVKNQVECPDVECERYGELMQRDYSSISLGGASGGTFKTDKQLLKEKQAQKKLRSKRHFKHEVLPTLDETPKIKKHFNDKFKDI